MNTLAIYISAAIAEIGGCFAFWDLAAVGTVTIVGHRGRSESCYLWLTANTGRSSFCGTRLRGLRRGVHRGFFVMAPRNGRSSSRSVGYYWGGNLSCGRGFNPLGPHDLSFTRI